MRRALPGLEPDLEAIAEGLPAGEDCIDLLAHDGQGRIVIVLVADRDDVCETARLLARGLAARRWLERDLPGWLQLLPELEIGADTPVRCILFARRFDELTRAAAAALPADWVELAIYRPFVHDGHSFLLLEHGGAGSPTDRPRGETAVRPAAAIQPRRARQDEAAFRSGLTEADFELSRPERRSLGPMESPRPRYAPDVRRRGDSAAHGD